MLYETTTRECSGCLAEIMWVTALEYVGPKYNWRTRKVFRRACGCGLWMNDRRERRTECPDGSLFVFEEGP